jgi:hypothetical protein
LELVALEPAAWELVGTLTAPRTDAVGVADVEGVADAEEVADPRDSMASAVLDAVTVTVTVLPARGVLAGVVVTVLLPFRPAPTTRPRIPVAVGTIHRALLLPAGPFTDGGPGGGPGVDPGPYGTCGYPYVGCAGGAYCADGG